MFRIFARKNASLLTDTFSGMTVSLALIPEAIAFALVAGVSPLAGLWATVIVGFIAASLGGRPGMISGATGALAVVMFSLVMQHGTEYLFATVVLMGIFQLLAGVFRLGKLIWMVPYPVLLGAVNGLAIVIFIAQLEHFQLHDTSPTITWIQGIPLYTMLGFTLLTMLIIKVLPLFTRKIPSSLVAILTVTLIVHFFNINTPNVGDMGKISGTLPDFHIPVVPLNYETLSIIAPYALVLSLIGLIEALLTMGLIDEITHTHGQANRECMGQGAANIVAGFFSTMGGCAMIGQSVLNVESGGVGRSSGMIAAALIMLYILFGGQWIEQIPIAALAGVMFIVVIETFEWSSFRILRKIPITDALILVTVSVITAVYNLSVAVIAGVILSALTFSWEFAKHILATEKIKDNQKVYELHGPLFYNSVKYFKDLFHVFDDPKEVIIDFKNSRVCDHSAIKAIDDVVAKYLKAGKRVRLRHLSEECDRLLAKGSLKVLEKAPDDPYYHVSSDQ